MDKNEEINYWISQLKILEDEISLSSNKLDGKIAFKLYDTYGFPLDLTQDYHRSKSIEVDV